MEIPTSRGRLPAVEFLETPSSRVKSSFTIRGALISGPTDFGRPEKPCGYREGSSPVGHCSRSPWGKQASPGVVFPSTSPLWTAIKRVAPEVQDSLFRQPRSYSLKQSIAMAYTLEEGTKRQHTFTPYIAFRLFILGSGSISYGYTAAIIGTTLGKQQPATFFDLVLISRQASHRSSNTLI